MTSSHAYYDQQRSTGSAVYGLSTPLGRWITQRGPVQFCVVHGKYKHTTDQCMDIAKLREEKQQRSTTDGTKLSGEGTCHQLKKPH